VSISKVVVARLGRYLSRKTTQQQNLWYFRER